MAVKKVLYVFCSSNYSGAEIVIVRLIENNRSVTPIVLCPQGAFSDLLVSKGIKTITNNSLKALNRSKDKKSKLMLLAIIALKFLKINIHLLYILLKNRIDAIHANNLSASVYIIPAVLLLKPFKVNCLWSNHDLVYPDGEKMDKLATNCVKVFDVTLAVSIAVKRKFPDVLQHKIEVLYNGLDVSKFVYDKALRANFRQQIGVDDNIIVFAIVGLIIPRKGHLLLFEAFQSIIQEYKNIKLLVVGKFIPNEYEYEEKIKGIIDNKQIVLLGHTNNIAELYSGIDVLVNASLPEMSEPLGTTIYEAMAFNRIVIASNTGGSPEIIDNNLNGFLFEAGNINSLKQVMKQILNNWQGLEGMRTEARALVEKRFNIQQMVTTYNTILDTSSKA